MRDPHKELEEIAKQLWWELDWVIKYSDTQFLKEYLPPIIQAFKALDIDFPAFMQTEGQIYPYSPKDNIDWIGWL